MFKCPDSYCIHFKRVCDGNPDCQNGEDEEQCENYYCPGTYIFSLCLKGGINASHQVKKADNCSQKVKLGIIDLNKFSHQRSRLL